MGITFKQFLSEGGGATQKYNTSRANQSDIQSALTFVGKVIDIPVKELSDSLLGSTELTLLGKRKDSGDIDIALPLSLGDEELFHEKMMKAVNNEGHWNAGGKIGSYAVPVGNGKKVQVDLMFVSDKKWAKFIYHSSEGDRSKYKGIVRNIILFTALTFIQKDGDFVERDDSGDVVSRASRSINMNKGMSRLFKVAKVNDITGEFSKTLKKVSPEDVESFLKKLGKNIKFSNDEDTITDPDEVASFIFGPSVKAKDIMTAEDVIKQIKQMKNKDEVIAKVKKELKKNDLPIPDEL